MVLLELWAEVEVKRIDCERVALDPNIEFGIKIEEELKRELLFEAYEEVVSRKVSRELRDLECVRWGRRCYRC